MAGTLSIERTRPRSVAAACGDGGRAAASEALLRLTAASRDVTHSDRLTTLLDRPEEDWATLWQLAAEQDVLPLLAHRLASVPPASMEPPGVRETAAAIRRATLLRNMALQAELQRIGRLLQPADIPMVPLKGTALAQRIFGTLEARRCGDIDILVPENQWGAAYEMLLDDGYRPRERVTPGVKHHAFHGIPLVRESQSGGFVVELHWSLFDRRFVDVDERALWQRVPACHANGPLRALPNEELLLFLAVHSTKHSAGGLRLLADLDQLIACERAALDWDRLRQLAADWQASDLLYFPLHASRQLLGTPIPEPMLDALRPPRWKRAVVKRLAGQYAIFRPPVSIVEETRVALAHCAMLRPATRIPRAYWALVLMPPADDEGSSIGLLTRRARLLLAGLTRSIFAISTSLVARRQPPAPLG